MDQYTSTLITIIIISYIITYFTIKLGFKIDKYRHIYPIYPFLFVLLIIPGINIIIAIITLLIVLDNYSYFSKIINNIGDWLDEFQEHIFKNKKDGTDN